MRKKAREPESEYSALPLLSRRALCTHYSSTLDRVRQIEKSFIGLAHHQINSCANDENRAVTLWDRLDEALQSLADVFADMLKAYSEILVAHVAGSSSVTEHDAQGLIASFNETATQITKHVTRRIPRWLKFACDGEIYTEEDIKFIDGRRQKWAIHNPAQADDFQNSFETKCELCGSKVRKLAFHLGGAEFDIPESGESNWDRHGCYTDGARMMSELLRSWNVPSWFIRPEFVGTTVPLRHVRFDSASNKPEELEPIKVPIAEKVTRAIRSEMEQDVQSVMREVAKKAEQQLIHEAALALAKKAPLNPPSQVPRSRQSRSNGSAYPRFAAKKSGNRNVKADEMERREKIFIALSLGYKGMPYSKLLDRLQLSTRARWQARGCPRKYSDAYANEKWQDRVSDEKYQFQRKFNDLVESEKAKYRERATCLLSKSRLNSPTRK
jgi:hypothetical protein